MVVCDCNRRKLAKPSPPSIAFQLQMVVGFMLLSLLCYSIPMEFQYLLPLRYTFIDYKHYCNYV